MDSLRATVAEKVSSVAAKCIASLGKARGTIKSEVTAALEDRQDHTLGQLYGAYKKNKSLPTVGQGSDFLPASGKPDLYLTPDGMYTSSSPLVRTHKLKVFFMVLGVVLSVTKAVLLRLVSRDLTGAAKREGWGAGAYTKNVVKIVGVQALVGVATFVISTAIDRVMGHAHEKITGAVIDRLVRLESEQMTESELGDTIDNTIDFVIKTLGSLLPSNQEIESRLPTMAAEQVLWGEKLDSVISEQLR